MNIFGKFIVVFIALNYSVLATADDTDIYLETSSSGGDGSLPLVMMTLDYRPNLGSGFCNSAMSTTSCQTDFGIPATCTNPGADSGWVADCYESGDVTKDLLASVRVYRALDVAPTDTVSLFDAMRAVTKVLFTNLSGVKVGYMMSHDNSCSGSSFAGPTTTGCSNGAYILKGFFDPSDDTNIAPIAAGIPHAEGRTYSCDADGVGGMDTTTVNADGTITGPDIF